MALGVDLRRCSLAKGAAPLGCDWCGKPLTGRQKRWCGRICEGKFLRNHKWLKAREAALARDLHRCVRCGSKKNLEVNHKVPLIATSPGRDRVADSCAHHLDELETLCHDCHLKATAKQRADGLIPKPRWPKRRKKR